MFFSLHKSLYLKSSFSDILEEGGYLNGNIWNGKAMKYRNDKLVYEEEISNGKKIKGK